MSENRMTSHELVDQIPILPEARPSEPVVQCGVLYLGTVPTISGVHGLDSVQEPLSHRYPVDGTNTIRGIDGVLYVYENGIQLTYTRHPRAAVFFPIASLVYSASVRFSVVDHYLSKPSTVVDWRFMPLDTLITHDSKHPPVFCLVVRRTQILPADECHCFITKSTDAAFSLVQALSQAYSFARLGKTPFRSPVFYQLDTLGRRISETTNVIYMSPANDDNSPMNRVATDRLKNKSKTQEYLLNPMLGGFYYLTLGSILDKWQLWDDDENSLIESRPRPPASPFGLHEGLYHDDTTGEIEKYLRHMEDEDIPYTCSCSSSASCCSDATSAEDFEDYDLINSKTQKPNDDTDEFNTTLLTSCKSSFEPHLEAQKNKKTKKKKKKKKAPIIVEKVVPKPQTTIPILNFDFPDELSNHSRSLQEPKIASISQTQFPSFSYTINERGEKITKEGNRIIFMDTIQPDVNGNRTDSNVYPFLKSRSRPNHHQQPTKNIPVIDMPVLQKLMNEKNSNDQQLATTIMSTDDKASNHSTNTNPLTKPHIIEILNGYLSNYLGYQLRLKSSMIQSTSDHSESSSKQMTQGKNSSSSSYTSTTNDVRSRAQSISTVGGPSIEPVKDPPSIISVASNKDSSLHKPTVLNPSSISPEKVQDFVTNIYGIAQSVKSSISSRSNRTRPSFRNVPVVTSAYTSSNHYVRPNFYANIITEYHNAY